MSQTSTNSQNKSEQIEAFLRKSQTNNDSGSQALLSEAVSLLTDIKSGLDSQQLDLNIPSQIPPKKDEIEKVCRGIGHDFNGVLANIRGLVEITQMMEPNAPENVQKTFTKILSLVERGHRDTEGVRAYGKVLSVNKAQLDLHKCLRRGLNDVKTKFELDFSIDFTCPEDIFIEFDEAQFDVLLTQLCDNSLYAIKARDVTSELTISVVQTDDKNIELSVSDNGKGIAADVGDKVFFPFYSTKKTGEGLGLGLSIVKQIVMNHDGHIYYSSEPEKGTKFVCVLPVVV